VDKKIIGSIKRKTFAALLVLLCCVFLAQETEERARRVQTYPAALSGRVIAIDPGHGGYDGGAKSVSGRWEKEYNLEIAGILREELERLGAKVVMTREGDYALCDASAPIRKKLQDMQRRAALALGGGADVLLSIHMNQYRDARESGPQVFYRADCPAGKLLAQTLQEEMLAHLSPAKARTAAPGDFYMVSIGIPAALVECGFLSNPAEAALLGREDYGKRIARALSDGLCRFFFAENPPQAAPAKADGVEQ